MENCDKCGVIVYEKNLTLIGGKFVCPSCQGNDNLDDIWTEKELAELHDANIGNVCG